MRDIMTEQEYIKKLEEKLTECMQALDSMAMGITRLSHNAHVAVTKIMSDIQELVQSKDNRAV